MTNKIGDIFFYVIKDKYVLRVDINQKQLHFHLHIPKEQILAGMWDRLEKYWVIIFTMTLKLYFTEMSNIFRVSKKQKKKPKKDIKYYSYT